MMRLQSAKRFILDLLYPNFCPFCGKIIEWDKRCCDDCYESLNITGGELCKCGKETCICSEVEYDDAITACRYYGNTIDGIITMKNGSWENAVEIFADILADKISKVSVKPPYRYIVPVPMSKEKLSERGYNQAEVLAKALGKRLGLPVKSRWLGRYRSSDSQHELTYDERLETMQYYYISKAEPIVNSSVLLCDDVLTTGATASACARLLRKMGAERVTAVCCATVANAAVKKPQETKMGDE